MVYYFEVKSGQASNPVRSQPVKHHDKGLQSRRYDNESLVSLCSLT